MSNKATTKKPQGNLNLFNKLLLTEQILVQCYVFHLKQMQQLDCLKIRKNSISMTLSNVLYLETTSLKNKHFKYY